MGIAENILATRLSVHMTQEQLAEAAGVSRQTVAKWESGATAPDLEHAAAIAEAVGTTLDTLVSFDCDSTGIGAPPRGRHLFGNVKVGERGQIVIPKEARDLFGIKPGDTILILGDEDKGGIALVKVGGVIGAVENILGRKKE